MTERLFGAIGALDGLGQPVIEHHDRLSVCWQCNGGKAGRGSLFLASAHHALRSAHVRWLAQRRGDIRVEMEPPGGDKTNDESLAYLSEKNELDDKESAAGGYGRKVATLRSLGRNGATRSPTSHTLPP